MKRIIVLAMALVLTIVTTNVFAQDTRFAIGLEVGPSFNSLYGNDIAKSNDVAVRTYAGLSFQYNLSSLLSLRTGLAYERKGAQHNLMATDQNGTNIDERQVQLVNSYLTVPVLLRASFGEKVRFFVNAGPYIGFGLKHYITGFTDKEEDDSEYYKKTDFGLSFGAGLSYPVGSAIDLSLETRNNLGLADISKTGAYNGGSVKTNSFNILLGAAYKF